MKPTPRSKKEPSSSVTPPQPQRAEQQFTPLSRPDSRPPPNRTPIPQGAIDAYASALQQNLRQIKEESSGPPPSESRMSQKRAAVEAPAQQPPLKQQKMAPSRKYTQRPSWAQLSKHNPKFGQQNAMANGARRQNVQSQRSEPQAPQVTQQQNGPQANGQLAINDVELDGRDPWTYPKPLDMDLIEASQVLGKWEKTFRWNTPYPDMLREVQNWLFAHLDQLGDAGTDPREGTIEIEAKIGTLLIAGSDDERCNLPVGSMAIIRPEANGRYHFESQMTPVRLHCASVEACWKCSANK